MTDYRAIIRLYHQGISGRTIATTLNCSRNTVSETLKRFEQAEMPWPLPAGLSDRDLANHLYPEHQVQSTTRKVPDYEVIHKEMARPGVTLSLLWKEYCDICRISREIPYMYTQFCKQYRDYASVAKATMHIHRKPGEQMEVDWAGQTGRLIDRDTGELTEVYIFIAALPCSQYAYVEAFPSQNLENWISAHVNAYRYFGGVTRILIPDNLKTGVDKASWYTSVINKTYHEMAEHYGTVVIPARVRKPKDKASVESTVGNISTWIVAALRHQKFFTVREMNEAIWEKLDDFNQRPFQKKPGSRYSVFIEEEKMTLMPLPDKDYELATWKVATVQFNYHIAVDKMYYSVPFEYIKHKVDVRITRNVIEVFSNHQRICSHPRLRGREGQYSTRVEHMPEDHKKFTAWNAERFISWAQSIGTCTEIAIRAILASHKVEQQGYRSCMACLKLAEKHGASRLEAACQKALSYTPSPSYKSIQTILKTQQDKLPEEPKRELESDYAFTRGCSSTGFSHKAFQYKSFAS